jgi:hypothetical protein
MGTVIVVIGSFCWAWAGYNIGERRGYRRGVEDGVARVHAKLTANSVFGKWGK